jgi:hypothetical protein
VEFKLNESDGTRTKVTKSELLQHFQRLEPSLNTHTFSWRIHDLHKRNVLRSIGRGRYSLHPKPVYMPKMSIEVRKLSARISKGFGEVAHCIQETKMLNELSRHQAATDFVVVEIEKESAASLFYYLRAQGYKDVFLKPDAREMELYVLSSAKPIVIMPILSRSPLLSLQQGRRKVNFPALEKILVDLFCDEKIFFLWGGEETRTIFRNAAARYSLNYTTLLSYASRRGKQSALHLYLREVIGKEYQDLFP